jgi:lipoprotein-releasing system permease protein
MGGKFVLADRNLTNQIRVSQSSPEALIGNGINVRFHDWEKAPLIKQQLEKKFQEAGIDPYWKIETFREFEFTRDILQQLNSEKRLFTMLATIIIVVACSNIISMLIILVNDKKVEIGILRSMGASSYSIALIFGFCGIVMGIAGSFIGTLAAFLTLRNLHAIVNFISRIQGYDMLNPVFYGDTLPTSISLEAFLFVLVSTVLISLVSGLVPAIKACLMRPSAILKAE